MKKILHIASFHGNIGDNASHLGFYSILDKIGLEYEVTQLEIRKSYNNYELEDKLIFDDEFVEYANTFDYLVFGGGGFLDYWVEGTVNGTTVNIHEKIFDQLQCKILITSIGSNPHRLVPAENYKKFEQFLKYVKSNNNLTVAFRNDGSINSIKKDFPLVDISDIPEILDNGFFYSIVNKYDYAINKDYVAINITKDQLEMKGEEIGDWYYKELELLISMLVSKDYHIVFVPHIHSDIEAIASLVQRLSPQLVRNHTSIAPCLQGDLGTDFVFNIYKNSKLTIASRFHANVCAMKFGIPTIGLSPLPRIEYIHKQLIGEKSYNYIEAGFCNRVKDQMKSRNSLLINEETFKNLKMKTIDFYNNYFKNGT